MSADGYFYYLTTLTRKYEREPESRRQCARLAMRAAIALFAAESSISEAAVDAAEAITDLQRGDRQTDGGADR